MRIGCCYYVLVCDVMFFLSKQRCRRRRVACVIVGAMMAVIGGF